MGTRLFFSRLGACLLLSACSVKIPDGKFKCEVDADCPSDFFCVESRCSREPEKQPGAGPNDDDDDDVDGKDDGGRDGGGNTGSSVDGDSGTTDGGIDVTSCAVKNTYYFDGDGDGLGITTNSIEACGVGGGYVDNANDCNDGCKACTTAAASEACDGNDNDCDGAIDEGALKVGAGTTVTAIPDGYWVQMLATDVGTVVLVSEVVTGGVRIVAQRLDATGALMGTPVELVPKLAWPSFAAAYQNGLIVLAYPDNTGTPNNETRYKVTTRKSSDLSEVTAPVMLGAAKAAYGFTLDLALSTSTAGKVMVLFDEGGVIKAQARKLTDLSAEDTVQTVFTQTGSTGGSLVVRLAVGPCLSGFYAVIGDQDVDRLLVQPLTKSGAPSGTLLEFEDDPKADLFTALPAVRVEGGSCSEVPKRLVLAYARSSSKSSSDPQPSTIELKYLDITRTGAFGSYVDKLVINGGRSIATSDWVIPAFGYFAQFRSLAISEYAGSYLLAAAAVESVDVSNKYIGNITVYEVAGDNLVASYDGPSPPAPDVPFTLHLGNVGTRPFLATGRWNENKAPVIFPLGYCQ